MSRTPLTRAALADAPLQLAVRTRTRVLARVDRAGSDRDAGMTTAEYAVGTVAACGFSGVLYKVVTSPQVLDILKSVIGRAFRLSF